MESIDGEGRDFPEPVWIHRSRGMERLAAERRESLPLGVIPAAFHYETPRQSALWLEVARRHAPEGLERFYGTVFAGMEPGWDHLVGLGTGGGWKERALLERHPVSWFTPLDASPALALLSAGAGRGLVVEPVRPVVADVTRFPDLPAWLDTADRGGRRLFTAFGLTPNTVPGELLPALRGFLRERDRLLVSANLVAAEGGMEAVVPEYDNEETRRWLEQVLIDWGIREELGELRFAVEEMEGESAVVGRAAWLRDGEIPWEGGGFRVRKGDTVRVFFSIRYTLERFAAVLRDAGMEVERVWESDCGREGLALVRRRDSPGAG